LAVDLFSRLSLHYQDHPMTVLFLGIDLFIIVKTTLPRWSNDSAFPNN